MNPKLTDTKDPIQHPSSRKKKNIQISLSNSILYYVVYETYLFISFLTKVQISPNFLVHKHHNDNQNKIQQSEDCKPHPLPKFQKL